MAPLADTCVWLAMIAPRLFSPTQQLRSRAAHPQASEAPPVQLLTTPPEEMPDALGIDAGNSRGIWQALRKGLDPTNDPIVEVPHKDQGMVVNSQHVSVRMQRRLAESCAPLRAGEVTTASLSEAAGTQKMLVQLRDGLSVECVLIPMGRHTSVCISSQVGCSRGCRFCSTGTMGLVRNLDTHEIVHQVWLAQRVVREQRLPQLVNVVFMGMGEPLNNLASVSAAVRLLTHPQAFAMSPRSVCVSTVAPSPAAVLAAAALPCKLAWSVHAADDELRRLLVPTTRHTMATLRDTFREGLAPRSTKMKALLVEVALIRGINDQRHHAEQLARFVACFAREEVLVNLIPYNDNGLGLPDSNELFRQPLMADVRAFQRQLWEHGVLCTVRATKGDDERSACGQLATSAPRRSSQAKRDAAEPAAMAGV